MNNELSPEQLVNRIPYFARLPVGVQEAVIRTWGRRTVEAGVMIFLEGEPTAGLYAIATGQVRIFKISPEGKEQGLHLLGPGNTFNDVSTLDGGPNPANALALENSVLYHLDRDRLMDLMAQYPALAHALVEFLAARTRFLVGKVEELAFHSVATRLARLLLEQAALSAASDELTLPRQRWMTQQEMAAQLGTAREVVGRILRQFAADDLIEFDRHQIVILDREAMERTAAGL
ncbi:MAG: Crp/Fnr family transcriptional regulator [Chloroflexota bacterium]|nr:Crp/Fnr family transcriptional regulator [Chloroflexota bacterium]